MTDTEIKTLPRPTTVVWHATAEAAMYAALPKAIGRTPTADDLACAESSGHFICLPDADQLHGWVTPNAEYLQILGELSAELAREHAQIITTPQDIGMLSVLAVDILAESPLFPQTGRKHWVMH